MIDPMIALRAARVVDVHVVALAAVSGDDLVNPVSIRYNLADSSGAEQKFHISTMNSQFVEAAVDFSFQFFSVWIGKCLPLDTDTLMLR